MKIAWKTLMEICEEHLTKGTDVEISGFGIFTANYEFIPCLEIQSYLEDYIQAPSTDISAYSVGVIEVASACVVRRNIVRDGLNAIFQAIIDILKHNPTITISLNCKFCKIVIEKGILCYKFISNQKYTIEDFSSSIQYQDEDNESNAKSKCIKSMIKHIKQKSFIPKPFMTFEKTISMHYNLN